MSKILIDGRFVGVGDSMTRYILEILKRLLPLDKENQYTLLLRPQGVEIAKQFLGEPVPRVVSSSGGQRHGPGIQDVKKPLDSRRSLPLYSMRGGNDNLAIEVLDIPHYSLSEQTKLLQYLNQKKFDLVHFIQFNHPVRYRGKFVVTIHDLTLMHYGEGNGPLKQMGFRAIMKSAVKNSSKIITISETSKKDIARFYGIKPEKVAVTHLAVDPKYNPRIENRELRIKQFKASYGISGDYILYTGMWKKHKNILKMLDAFKEYKTQHPTSNIQLVMAGKIDNREPEVLKKITEINGQSLGAIHRPVITTGFLTESELPLAYAGAVAYCIPSLSEGFGLPPLEAMASGIPVISSNISAMPEILGDAPLYFNPLDVADIAEAMEKVITDKDLRAKLIEKGLKQAGKYSWEATAKKTLEVYEKVLI